MAYEPLSEEDKALFRESMRDVKPLHEQDLPTLSSQSSASPASQATWNVPPSSKFREKETETKYFLSDYIYEPVYSETILSYAKPYIPKQRLQALKQGQILWQARLDLHGLNSEEAKQALIHFITHQRKKNNKCLLIIHGKGSHEKAPPILK